MERQLMAPAPARSRPSDLTPSALARLTTALVGLALIGLASACNPSTDGESDSLTALELPPRFELVAAEAAARGGELDRAMDHLTAVGASTVVSPERLRHALQIVLEHALDASRADLALSLLALLQPSGARDLADRALALRVADASSSRVDEFRYIDRRVRQVRADAAQSGIELTEATCHHLEQLYWHRFRRAELPAYRIDALAHVRQVCPDPAVRRAVADRYAELAAQSEAAGHAETAVAYLEQLVSMAEPEAADPRAIAARERIRELLWPTFLARASHTFGRKFAQDWIERGLIEEGGDTLTAPVQVGLPTSCPPAADGAPICPELSDAGRRAARGRLAELAREAGQLAASYRLGPPLADFQLTLERVEGDTAYFAAALPLETLFLAIYQAAPSDDGTPTEMPP